MDDITNNEEIFHYYTIIGKADSLIESSNDGSYALVGNVFNEEDKQIMLVSLDQDIDETLAVNNAANETDTDGMDIVSELENVSMPDIELILPENSLDADEESLMGYEPELVPVKPVDSKACNTTEEEEEDELDKTEEEILSREGYHKVRLEDGSFAYIDNELWNSLILSSSKELAAKKQQKANAAKAKKDKKFECAYEGCNKSYSSPHHLMVHERKHTGSRPYRCLTPNCGKSFSTGYTLKAHIRTHTGEAPYCCTVCPKNFKTSGDLQKHMRTHTGEKPFKCPYEGCNGSFTTSNIRKVHIRSHTGERPYACTYPDCKKAFASATNFKNHMRIHSGEKPYKCKFNGCEKRFTEYSSLFKHNVVHQPSANLRCEYCERLCKNENSLRAHKENMHKDVLSEDECSLDSYLVP